MADTEVSKDTQNELNDLRMSDAAVPLYEHVKSFIKDVVNPMSEEFHRLGEGKTDIWSYAPGQLEALEKAKDEAKKQGLWNFFLPDAETGEGLKNLDYAYIAAELGKNPLASESMNCSAPDTGNMEVLERVGTPEQKERWLKPLLEGKIRSAFAMTEPALPSSDAKNVSMSAVLEGDEWVINGEKFYISGAGDPRCKIMITMVKTSPDAARTSSRARSWCRCRIRASPFSAPCTSSVIRMPRMATCTSVSRMYVCRRKTCCSAKAVASRFPSFVWGLAASTTACGRSVRLRRHST